MVVMMMMKAEWQMQHKHENNGGNLLTHFAWKWLIKMV